jgi:diguanylate cyclase (GGDEF)-like protein
MKTEAEGVVSVDRPSLNIAEILASVGEVAYRWNIQSDALIWGPNVCSVFNISNTAVIGTGHGFASLVVQENMQSRATAVLNSPLRDHGAGVPYQVQYALRTTPSITPLWVEDTGRWFAGPDGRAAHAHGVIRVINERRAEEERLAYLSTYDDLTGEMNRRHFTEKLAAAIAQTAKLRNAFGFLLVAIDDLARVNAAYGFTAGDEVIAAIAKRLRTKMRSCDHLGRLTGNKFGIILNACDPQELAAAAERFLAAVRDDVIRTSSGTVAVTASVGAVIAPRHAQSVHQVLSRAHEALHAGKLKRRGGVEVFHPDITRDSLRRQNMRASDEIIEALNERRIISAFEPVADALSRRPVFYECLMRVRRPDGKLAIANDIMPIAERLGLIRLIDHRMLELVLAEMAALPDVQLSLNLSPSSADDHAWWHTLTACLASAPGIAGRLTIEITESAAIGNMDEAQRFVGRLKNLGCRIALDDFGAGYTSFRNIRELGVDIIKIDGSYVRNLADSAEDQIFVRLLVELGKKLGLKTVAEWVRDEATAALLTGWGCDYLQGELIGTASLAPPRAA